MLKLFFTSQHYFLSNFFNFAR
ncbi:Hypothetical Protein MfeM64YM_0326 [Mycoplasmopsis fermentans M64]|uniref:Uncharacterized protein n=1 Tax=Mycoplasmopsis fermentans (strain M64) TaxID=943945 RepID=A0AB32XB82_MYCFM|nr:Hypothetical Protein MfeM64YM_0326 [Mycoplasmopsis fermentans M64]